MFMYPHLRYLSFISVLCLLNHSIFTSAQPPDTLKDLPKCAMSCAEDAAFVVGCKTTNTLCICAHQLSVTIIQCSSLVCHPPELDLVEKVLDEICADSTTTTLTTPSSTPLTTIQSNPIPTTTSSISTSQTSSTPTVPSTTPDVVGSLSQTTTQLASSTVVIVTTVVVPPTSTTTSRAGRLDVSISTRALFFCLPSLISLFTAI